MGKKLLSVIAIITMIGIISGCSVNTKLVERERVDQELSEAAGNRGYLMGTPPPAGERKTTRKYYETQVEIFPVEEADIESDVVVETLPPEPAANYGAYAQPQESIALFEPERITQRAEYTNYIVQKGDTLQKISKKTFGTTRKWKKIFKANQDILKSPDKIRPGMTLKIPNIADATPRESDFIK